MIAVLAGALLATIAWVLLSPAPEAVGVALVAATGFPGRGQEFDYTAYARVLEQYVTPEGRVDYAALQKNPTDLQRFLGRLASASPKSHPDLFPTPESQIAYWINAYNAFVIQGVLDGYPVGSVRALKFGFGLGFFKSGKYVAGGKKYSLDNIEHGILRKQYQEPRIHFAVNCASVSCPPLRNKPYRPETLNQQLDQAARDFLNNPENVRLEGQTLFLSRILKWYDDDFLQELKRSGEDASNVVPYVLRYLPEEKAQEIREAQPRLKFNDYDWSLNDTAGDPG